MIKLLLSVGTFKNMFFQKIDDAFIFNAKALIEVLSAENKFLESRTTYAQSIGLTKKDDFIQTNDDVVLSFPFKDTVFVGGQEKDDEKTNENFLHEVINANDIARVFEPKVMTNIKKYSKDKIENNPTITENDNLIIKGNNLLALHSLLDKADGEALYRGKVKLIYIDPPYNTGNDSFNYNDNFSHSTWLTFMKNRIEVAREFLSDDGVIFITTDDNEQAYLKVLMDEVFGRENFIADVIWNSRKSVQNDTIISLATNHNLFYAKQKTSLSKNNFRLAVDESKFKYDDNDGRGKYKADPFDAPNIRPNLTYPIVNPNTNETYMPPVGRCCRTGQKEYENFLRDNRILFGKTGKSKPQLKKYLNEEKSKGSVATTLWNDLDTTTNATKHLEKMFGKKMFDTPKPENLIERIIQLSTSKNDLVMDYHLGSGTTCAVAHKMGRRYIGIEQMDYIEDIAVERMKKVIEGEQGGISKAVEWQGGGEFVYMELKELDAYKDTELEHEMRYLPIEEIEDETYGISKEEREANFAFYGIDSKRD
ncbi:MAG: site-specific DNA-methyltransferase [Epsilonproteobacteria bacterium]|nr:site-specific DNA-methyltransferase [Campylobacterota bacterium]